MICLYDTNGDGDCGRPACPLCAGGRTFPIQGGAPIPWWVIARHESTARRNHDQTLERLAQRGGLGAEEALDVFLGQRYGTWWDRATLAVRPDGGALTNEQRDFVRRKANTELLVLVEEAVLERAARVEAARRRALEPVPAPPPLDYARVWDGAWGAWLVNAQDCDGRVSLPAEVVQSLLLRAFPRQGELAP